MLNIIIVILMAVVLLVLSCLIIATYLNQYLPKWFCDKMGWHLAPKQQGFDNCSSTGICPRCKKSVLQDSQGNWF